MHTHRKIKKNMNEQNLKNHSTFINLLVCILKDFFLCMCMHVYRITQSIDL